MTEGQCRKQAPVLPTEDGLQERESDTSVGKLRQGTSVTEERR